MLKDEPEMSETDVFEFIELLHQNHIDVCIDGGWGVDAPSWGGKPEFILTWILPSSIRMRLLFAPCWKLMDRRMCCETIRATATLFWAMRNGRLRCRFGPPLVGANVLRGRCSSFFDPFSAGFGCFCIDDPLENSALGRAWKSSEVFRGRRVGGQRLL